MFAAPILPDDCAAIAFAGGGTDWLGISLLAVALISLQIVLNRGEIDDWLGSPLIRDLAGLSVATLAGFLLWQYSPRNRAPLLDLALVRDRRVMSAILIGLFTGMILSGSLFVLPEYLRNISAHTYSATQTGQIICVYALTAAAVRPLMVPLIAHLGQRKTIVGALSLLVASMLLFQHYLTRDTAAVYYILPLVLYGLCLSPLLPAVGSGTVAQIAQDKLLDGVSLYMTFRQFGASLGVAFLTILLDHRETLHSSRLFEHLQGRWRHHRRIPRHEKRECNGTRVCEHRQPRPGIGTARRGGPGAGGDLELCGRVLVHGAHRDRSSMPRPDHAAYARDPQMSTPTPTPAATSGRTRFYSGQCSSCPCAATAPASRLPMVVGAVAIAALVRGGRLLRHFGLVLGEHR